jgi:lipopolysaccharide transport system ATP-binding protein
VRCIIEQNRTRMSDFAIEAEGLGKRYFLGEDLTLARLAKGVLPWRRGKGPPELWALRNASFTVKAGEAIGIIGRNGAGKSTLLKLLSRITAPSEGRATLRGRMSTLLEVGTGFHPDLTGRDNIFLSGTILGMSYAEVKAKFAEIVAFAEVEKFVDTPVKRYSSGMYVRLAFSVAAFLEPEILIVDEVLAVGDANFQRKSLGRLNDVSGHDGRTVLFVSHNLHAIRSFCRRALVLEGGRIIFDGPTEAAIGRYLQSLPARADLRHAALGDRLGRSDGRARFIDVTALGVDGQRTWQFKPGDAVTLVFTIEADATVPSLTFLLKLSSADDNRPITTIREVIRPDAIPAGQRGTVTLHFPALPLRPCEVSLYAWLGNAEDTVSYDVIDSNVGLPFLFINSDDDDKYARQGVVSLDYRLTSQWRAVHRPVDTAAVHEQ